MRGSRRFAAGCFLVYLANGAEEGVSGGIKKNIKSKSGFECKAQERKIFVGVVISLSKERTEMNEKTHNLPEEAQTVEVRVDKCRLCGFSETVFYQHHPCFGSSHRFLPQTVTMEKSFAERYYSGRIFVPDH